jgi:hypothetical protein
VPLTCAVSIFTIPGLIKSILPTHAFGYTFTRPGKISTFSYLSSANSSVDINSIFFTNDPG